MSGNKVGSILQDERDSRDPRKVGTKSGTVAYDLRMAFTMMSFTCELCGKELEAQVAVAPGYSAGMDQAKCPHCGLVQGMFPGKVMNVVEIGGGGLTDKERRVIEILTRHEITSDAYGAPIHAVDREMRSSTAETMKLVESLIQRKVIQMVPIVRDGPTWDPKSRWEKATHGKRTDRFWW